MDEPPVHEALRAALVVPVDRHAVLDALRRGRLLVALGRPDPDAPQPPGTEPGALHFLAMPRDDGLPTVLCFSGPDALRRWGHSPDYAVARLPELWTLLTERGLRAATIDPGGPVAVTLDGDDLYRLAGTERPAERELTLRAPATDRDGEATRLALALRAHPAVLSAWVLEDDHGRPVAALLLTPGTPPERSTAALEAAAGVLPAVVVTDWEAGMIRAEAVRPAFERSAPPAAPAGCPATRPAHPADRGDGAGRRSAGG